MSFPQNFYRVDKYSKRSVMLHFECINHFDHGYDIEGSQKKISKHIHGKLSLELN